MGDSSYGLPLSSHWASFGQPGQFLLAQGSNWFLIVRHVHEPYMSEVKEGVVDSSTACREIILQLKYSYRLDYIIHSLR